MSSFKFVKIKCNHYNLVYPEWFLVVSQATPLQYTQELSLKDRRNHTMIWKAMKESTSLEVSSILLSILSKNKDYLPATDMNKTYLVRKSSSYMLLTDSHEILEEYVTDKLIFPSETAAVIVCENDPENQYLEHWQKFFEGKTVKSINFFYDKSQEEIEFAFRNAEIIAFHTTFSDFGWWEKLGKAWKNTNPKPKIMGYCHDPDKWEEALKLYPVTVEVLGYDEKSGFCQTQQVSDTTPIEESPICYCPNQHLLETGEICEICMGVMQAPDLSEVQNIDPFKELNL